MKSHFDKLALNIIQSAKGKVVLYIPNPGNFGDGLIRSATKAFFNDYKIKHIEFNIGFKTGRYFLLPLILSGKYFIVYGGGGAWHRGYDFGFKIVRFINFFTKNYLVLPSTYDLSNINKLKGTLFSRDVEGSLKSASNSKICHDMALYFLVRGLKFDVPIADNNGIGIFFRTDQESSKKYALPENNVDVSNLGQHMSDYVDFFSVIGKYPRIRTDRLHVAIAGAILGRDVELYTGNYFKIEHIYNFSLSNMNNVKLIKE